MEIRISKRNLSAEVYLKEEKDYRGVKTYTVKLKLGDFEGWVEGTGKKDGTNYVSVSCTAEMKDVLARMFNVAPFSTYRIKFALPEEEDRQKIEKLLAEAQEKSKQAEREFYSYPTKLEVKQLTIYALDMFFDHKVLKPNKPEEFLTPEEKELLDRIKIGLTYEGKMIKDGRTAYIPAPETAEEGDQLTIEEVYEAFREEVERGFQKYRERMEETEKRKKEAEERIKKALEEAKRSGKEVVIQTVANIDGDSPSREERMLFRDILEQFRDHDGELGIITVYQVAKPDGTIDYKAVPSF